MLSRSVVERNSSSTGTKCRCHTDDNLHWSNVEHFETVRRERFRERWEIRANVREDLLNATVRTVRPSEFMDRFTWINEVISHSTFKSLWEFDVSSLLQNVSNFFSLFSFFNLNNLWLKGERDMLENKFTCQLIIQSMWQQKKTENNEITDKGGTKIGWNEANLSIIDRSRVDSAAKWCSINFQLFFLYDPIKRIALPIIFSSQLFATQRFIMSFFNCANSL